MKRYEMIKSKEKFNNIIQKGKKYSNKHFNIFLQLSDEYQTHFGLAVGKKIGNAVERNKIKRQLRNLIDNSRLMFKKNNNYIIMVKRAYCDLSYEMAIESFNELLRKVYNEK